MMTYDDLRAFHNACEWQRGPKARRVSFPIPIPFPPQEEGLHDLGQSGGSQAERENDEQT
jgi:hypothetical protein